MPEIEMQEGIGDESCLLRHKVKCRRQDGMLEGNSRNEAERDGGQIFGIGRYKPCQQPDGHIGQDEADGDIL